MTHWWRAEDSSIDHPKLLKLSDAMHRAWYTLMCISSANGGSLPPTEDIALRLRMKTPKVAEWIAHLVKAGLIDHEAGVFRPHNWDTRQYKSDDKPAKGKDSYVYFIGVSWDGMIKIGFSKNPWARVVDIQTSHHEKMEVLATFRCQAFSEVALHELLKAYRKQGEWFSLPAKIYVAARDASERKRSYEDLVVEITTLLRSTTTEAETEQIQTTEPDQKDSEAIASGADAPVDHRKRLFSEGLSKLATMTGKGPDACRSFVGKCLKASGDDAITVLGLIEDAERNQAVDPSAWIAARLKTTEIRNGTSKTGGSLIAAIDRRLAAIEGEASSDFALPEGNLRRLSHGPIR